MQLTLTDVLKLVGPLDDSPGERAARERFRAYLTDSVKEAGAVRDYVETCISTSGSQRPVQETSLDRLFLSSERLISDGCGSMRPLRGSVRQGGGRG